MIFITVGTQLPFDRLLRAMDDWVLLREFKGRIFAQIGESTYTPQYVQHKRFLKPAEFQRLYETARLIVAHAGMGSILTALELGKPIIVMPRHAALGEHRNDHQLATARYLRSRSIITVADNDAELHNALDRMGDTLVVPAISPVASRELIERLSAFFDAVAGELH